MIDSEQRRQLGAFVRARRESLTPEQPAARRRTPGLRREELAARAGIGATWVTWIEQGRAVRPSATTFARLADALSLGSAERAYLFTLAARHDPADPFDAVGDAAPPAIAAVVEALRGVAHAPVEFVGVPDRFGISAENYGVLLAHFRLTSEAVSETVRTLLRGKRK